MGPDERAANAGGVTPDLKAIYTPPVRVTNGNPAGYSVAGVTYSFNRPKPNVYSVIDVNFSYKIDNAFVATCSARTSPYPSVFADVDP